MQLDFNEWVCKRVEDLRESKGVSAREMSRGINKEETYIRQIETRKIVPSISVLNEICQYLKISVSDFFDDKVETPVLLTELISASKSLNKYELESVINIVELIAGNKRK